MTGFIIEWEGVHGMVIPITDQVAPRIGLPQQVFDTEEEALDEMIWQLDGVIAEARSARLTATKRLRKLKRKS